MKISRQYLSNVNDIVLQEKNLCNLWFPRNGVNRVRGKLTVNLQGSGIIRNRINVILLALVLFGECKVLCPIAQCHKLG